MKPSELLHIMTQSFYESKHGESVSNRDRSSFWVHNLALRFQQFYPKYTVKCRSFERGDQCSSELITDIDVVSFRTEFSRVRGVKLNNLVEAKDYLWAVESEFSFDERQMNHDFSKLNLVNAKNKLYVGPQVSDSSSLLNCLLDKVSSNQDYFYIALLPHPKLWSKSFQKIQLAYVKNKENIYFIR